MTQPVDRCLGFHHTRYIYNETIDTGDTTHTYTKEGTVIETGMVPVTLPFNNVTATPNGIRFKYLYGNISQETHSTLLKLPFLPVQECHVNLFDTLLSVFLLKLGKLYKAGCKAYLYVLKVYIFF